MNFVRHNLILLVVAVVLPFLLACRRRLAAERILFAAAVAAVFYRMVRKWQVAEPVVDLLNFHRSGLQALAGEDPYSPAYAPLLSPPTVLPLVKFLGLFPLDALSPYWQAGVAVATLLCPFVAWAALRTAREEGTGDLTPGLDPHAPAGPFPWGLAALMVASPAAEIGIILGQYSALATLALLGAIALRNVGRRVGAGLLLAFSTIKIGTLIPLMPLFLGRRDRRVWVALVVGGLALGLLGSSPSRWLDLCRSNLARIADTQVPGAVNDYDVSTGENFASVIGFGKLACYLGVPGRKTWGRIELAASLAMLAGMTWIVRTRRLPPAATVATACTAACLFLYHRVYDSLILAAPLFYSYAEAAVCEGWRRRLHLANVVGLILIPCTPWERVSNPLLEWSLGDGTVQRIARIAVVPMSTWLLLFALVVLVSTGWRRRPAE